MSAGARENGSMIKLELTDRETAILDFEERWQRANGAKEEAIRSTFHLSAARYYQLLNIVIDSPAALEAKPVLVYRLREQRARRTRARASRGFENVG